MKIKLATILTGMMIAVTSTTLPASASMVTSVYNAFSHMDRTTEVTNFSQQSRTKNLLIKQPIQISQVTVDLSGVPESVVKGVTGLLGYLGIQPSGTIKENNEVWCVFNEWGARDQRASIEGGGRFSLGTTFGGRWYCAMKRR